MVVRPKPRRKSERQKVLGEYFDKLPKEVRALEAFHYVEHSGGTSTAGPEFHHVRVFDDHFDPRTRFHMGEADSALVTASPFLWDVMDDYVREELKRTGAWNDPQVKILFYYVFNTEESYAEYLAATDKAGFLRGKLHGIEREYVEERAEAEARPDHSLGAPHTSAAPTEEPAEAVPEIQVGGHTVRVSGGMLEVDMQSVTRFITAVRGASKNIDVGDIYRKVAWNPKLTKKEQILFRHMFTNLYNADKLLGETFLLTVFYAISSKKDFRDIFDKLITQQINTMRNLWGGDLASIFEGMRDAKTSSLTLMEQYLLAVNANLCLASVLAGAHDKPIEARFLRAFGVGVLGGISGIFDRVAVKSMDELREVLKSHIEDPEDATWTAPISATVMMAAGVAARSAEYILVKPFLAGQQALLTNVGTRVSNIYTKAGENDKELRTHNPYVLMNYFGLLAAYGHNMGGTRGRDKPAFRGSGRSGRGTVPDRDAGISPVTNTLDANTIDALEEAVGVVNTKNWKTSSEMFAAYMAGETVRYAVNARFIQQEMNRDIPVDDLFEAYRTLPGKTRWEKVNNAKMFFYLVTEIISNSGYTIEDILDRYEDEGMGGLQKMLDEAKRVRSGAIPKRTRTRHV